MDLFFLLFVVSLCCVNIYGGIVYNTIAKTLVRSTPFESKVIDKTCLLTEDPGPCRADYETFYFNPSIMNCSTFKWGGCQGNGNRFDTLEDCLDTCLSKPGKQLRPKWCSLKFDYGFCFGETKRWYYDEKWKVCKETIYSGCGGNKNNFYSQEECESVCRFALGPLKNTAAPVRLKKVVILNPVDATQHRGLIQVARTNSASENVMNIPTVVPISSI